MRIPKRDRPAKGAPVLVGAISAATAFASGPVVRRVMLRKGILDNPNERSSHTVAVPRGGGWACLVGVATGCLAGRALGYQTPWKTVGGATLLALVGFADDQIDVPVIQRLAAQVGVGMAADASTKAFPFGLATVPTLVNVVNFMDGINGITALTATAWGAGAAAVGHRTRNGHVAVTGASLAGAALGFLPHNLRRDRMFLGDVGSYLIGGMMALTALHPSLSWRARGAVLAPLVPYLADTGITMARRAAQGHSLVTAHREHAYQKLANELKFGHIPVALMYAAVSAVLAGLATQTLPQGDK